MPYTSMDRSVALLCLIGLDRSRVITCHSRDIGYVYIPVHELLNLIWNEWKFETGREIMMRYRYGSRTGFLVVLVPSESVEDRTVVGPADYV